jgi:hypothetical protein
LGCDSLTQRQWPQCDDGFGKDEPSCQCANFNNATTFAPNIITTMNPTTKCTDTTKCRPGFDLSSFDYYPSFSVDRFSFLQLQGRTTASAGACPTKTTTIIGTVAGPSNTLLVAFSDGSVCLHRIGSSSASLSSLLNLASTLEIPGWRTNTKITAMKPHMAMPGLVWIAFTFSGICADKTYEGEPPWIDGGCSAIELLSLTTTGASSSSCALGVCAFSVTPSSYMMRLVFCQGKLFHKFLGVVII